MSSHALDIRALLLGQPGAVCNYSCESVSSRRRVCCKRNSIAADCSADEDLKEVAGDFAAAHEFLQRNCGVKISANSAYSAFLDYNACSQKLQSFFDEPASLHMVLYFGHGRRHDGAWLLNRSSNMGMGELSDLWNRRCTGNRLSQLLVVSDSCYSGKLCVEAARKKMTAVFVQASTDLGQRAMDGSFFQKWVQVQTAQLSPSAAFASMSHLADPVKPLPSSSLLQRVWMRQAQHPRYYAYGVKAGSSTLVCAALKDSHQKITLIGSPVNISSNDTVHAPVQRKFCKYFIFLFALVQVLLLHAFLFTQFSIKPGSLGAVSFTFGSKLADSKATQSGRYGIASNIADVYSKRDVYTDSQPDVKLKMKANVVEASGEHEAYIRRRRRRRRASSPISVTIGIQLKMPSFLALPLKDGAIEVDDRPMYWDGFRDGTQQGNHVTYGDVDRASLMGDGFNLGAQQGNLLHGTEYENDGILNKNTHEDAACAVCMHIVVGNFSFWGKNNNEDAINTTHVYGKNEPYTYNTAVKVNSSGVHGKKGRLEDDL